MSNEPVAWMVYTQDGQSCYVTDNPADISPIQRALPLYMQPFPTDEALLRQALESWANMTDTTHSPVCWSWGPRHYGCALRQIERDEALLRQALTALESADWYIDQLERVVYSPDDTGTHSERALVKSTIGALRERLGEGEQQ